MSIATRESLLPPKMTNLPTWVEDTTLSRPTSPKSLTIVKDWFTIVYCITCPFKSPTSRFCVRMSKRTVYIQLPCAPICLGFLKVMSSIMSFSWFDPSGPTIVFSSRRTRKLFSWYTQNLFWVWWRILMVEPLAAFITAASEYDLIGFDDQLSVTCVWKFEKKRK